MKKTTRTILEYAKAALNDNDTVLAEELLNTAIAAEDSVKESVQKAKDELIPLLNKTADVADTVNGYKNILRAATILVNLMEKFNKLNGSKVGGLSSKLADMMAKFKLLPNYSDLGDSYEVEEVEEVEETEEASVTTADEQGYAIGDPTAIEVVMKWHGGQGSALYKLGSSSHANKDVPRDIVLDAIGELEKDLDWMEDKPYLSDEDKVDVEELQYTIDYLNELAGAED